MTLFVFSSNRALGEFYQKSDEVLLPDCKNIKDFFADIIVVPGKAKIPPYLRHIFLWLCTESVDIGNLGFDRAFLRFLENSAFLFAFFDELHSSMVGIENIDLRDTYGDYSDHLRVLGQIYESYEKFLNERNLYDIKPEYVLHSEYLRTYDKIHIFVDGILSKFDFHILQQASAYTQIEIEFGFDRYNAFIYKNLISEGLDYNHRYIYSLNSGKIVHKESLNQVQNPKISLYSFEMRLNQSLLVIAKVNEWLEQGISDIAIIVPDESFKKFLFLFDTQRNLNYAMGLENTELLKGIKNLDFSAYDGDLERDSTFQDSNKDSVIQDSMQNIPQKASKLRIVLDKIREIDKYNALDDLLFSLECASDIFENLDFSEIMEFIISQIPSLDDNSGGKVKVIGVLESRGVSFEKLIIVDFNDDFIPSLGDNDMFLNTQIRQKCGMPTLSDKENLQKHYYYNAIKNAKEVCIAFHSARPQSSILEEIGFSYTQHNGDALWRFFAAELKKDFVAESFRAKNTLTHLSATRLRDFLDCPLRFYFKYICKLAYEKAEHEENDGSIVHNILQNLGRNFDVERVDSLFAKPPILENLASLSATRRLNLEITKEKLHNFFTTQKQYLKDEAEILEIEAERRFKIGEFEIQSRIDRIDRLRNGKIRVIDYKLKKNFDVKKEGFLQLLLYKKALRQEFGECEIECAYCDLLENKLYFMDKESESECEKTLESTISELTTGLSDEMIFERTESIDSCKYCDYKHLCDRW